jgi:replicative superfamily II helicase
MTTTRALASKAIFIGVNRYADDNISDLSGARWDAVALHALFSDSIPGLDARLFVDDEATSANVRAALKELLHDATPEDNLVVSFSGHGSQDHRLVLHDSAATTPDSMLAMSELADAFRTSPAKSILCILDCCFSGQAPARVLDQGPAPRGGADYLELFSGTGRILIAASGPSEAAWEYGGRGHGLLTKALMDVLMGATDTIEAGAAMGQIMAQVRAEAARLGRTQTPIVVNYVEGGFLLLGLKRGPLYEAAFPDRVGTVVSNEIRDLAAFGIAADAVDAWAGRFQGGLNPLQLSAVNQHRVLDGRNMLVIAPTGAGKTFVGEMAGIRAVSEGRRAVFLLPYKALVNEKYEEFVALYADRLHLRVIRCTGDYQDQRGAFTRGKFDIAVLTYEMFLNLCLAQPSAVQRFGLVVVDEAQFITEPRRGIAVELLLTLLLNARERGANVQIVALSAVIGSVNAFDEWLKAECLVTTERPVPLVEGVIDRNGTFQCRDTDGSTKTVQLLGPREVVMRRNEPKAQDVIVPLVRHLIASGETVLVFRNQRGSAEGCANYLADELGLPPATATIASLGTSDPSSSSSRLRACLERGVAFHNSHLARQERAALERSFRAAAGEVRVMAATTTLAAGINTPASTVILAENEFVGEDGRPFTIAEYKNMAGRAGRPGFDRSGRSVIYAATPGDREFLFRKYVLGSPEPVLSSFKVDDLETWVLRLLSQVQTIPKDTVPHLLANTFAGYAASKSNPAWAPAIEARLQALLAQMISLQLIEEEQGNVRLSLLGRACGRSALSFRSCMRLVDLLREFGSSATPRDLLVIIQCLADVDEGTYMPLNARINVEKSRPRQLSARIGERLVRLLQRFVNEDKDYLRRCKRTLALLDWIDGVPTDDIEKRYSVAFGEIGHGHIRGVADTTRFHLQAAAQIAQILFVSSEAADGDVEALLRRLELGVPTDMLALTELAIPWTRGDLLALRAMGVNTPERLLAMNEAALRGAVGPQQIAALNRLKTPAGVSPPGASLETTSAARVS